MPLAATDNGDGTSTLKVDTELTATIDPTGLATSAKQDTGNSSLSSINAKLPTLVGGKIPVDASVSIDAIDIGNVDITEFPAGNLGQQLKAASLSVAPATDITDATYLGDIKFGESLPAGSAIVGKVGIDQTTPGTTNLVNVNGGASQTSDIKVTLDSEKVAVSAIDAGTNLIGKVGIDQVTANANEVVVKNLSTIITEYNITLTSADTEYSQALPANTKKIEFWSRGKYAFRHSFVTGKVAGPTEPYLTAFTNSAYESPGTANLTSKTIYFATDVPGDVIEMRVWS